MRLKERNSHSRLKSWNRLLAGHWNNKETRWFLEFYYLGESSVFCQKALKRNQGQQSFKNCSEIWQVWDLKLAWLSSHQKDFLNLEKAILRLIQPPSDFHWARPWLLLHHFVILKAHSNYRNYRTSILLWGLNNKMVEVSSTKFLGWVVSIAVLCFLVISVSKYRWST